MPDRKPLSLGRAEHIGPDSLMETYHQFEGALGLPMAGTIEEAGTPVLRSLGKRLDELLDMVLTPKPGSGLPKRLRLTNWDAREGNVDFHSASKGERFQATPSQLDELIKGGALDVEQPPAGAVTAARKKISKGLDKARR